MHSPLLECPVEAFGNAIGLRLGNESEARGNAPELDLVEEVIGSIAPEASALATVVRAHWAIENRVHWCPDVALNDDQMRARVKNVGANLAIVRRLVLNLFRLDKSRKGGIHTRRILAASSDSYRESLLGFASI